MNKTLFGNMPCGKPVYKFTLTSEDSSAEIMTLGATILSFKPFGKEIVAAFGSVSDYLRDKTYHGASVGRFANRISGAIVEIDGTVYPLTDNDGGATLHGGSDGYHDKVWDIVDYGDDFARLSYFSPDGQSGFPGNVKIEAKFSLISSSLMVEYTAISDAKTPLVLTTHGYFNVDGEDGDVREQTLKFFADEYSEVDEKVIPTGKKLPVENTPFDFRSPRKIGERIGASPIGYDHNFVISPIEYSLFSGKALGLAAEVSGSELSMSVYTDQPGLQLYVLMHPMADAPRLASGKVQGEYSALCLEPQIEPDCVKQGLGIVKAGEVYTSSVVYSVKRV